MQSVLSRRRRGSCWSSWCIWWSGPRNHCDSFSAGMPVSWTQSSPTIVTPARMWCVAGAEGGIVALFSILCLGDSASSLTAATFDDRSRLTRHRTPFLFDILLTPSRHPPPAANTSAADTGTQRGGGLQLGCGACERRARGFAAGCSGCCVGKRLIRF